MAEIKKVETKPEDSAEPYTDFSRMITQGVRMVMHDRKSMQALERSMDAYIISQPESNRGSGAEKEKHLAMLRDGRLALESLYSRLGQSW